MPEAMDSRRSDLPSDEPLNVAAATLLLLAGRTACASEMPPWGRERALDLLDALLALATKHGFAQAEALRGKLTTGTRTERTRLLAEVAFDAVPASALLEVIRQSSFYIGE
ncbi:MULTISPECIES: hypothetical protein [Burkholderia]|uniref:hypothetical protein n=1 Tax=Burkholderia TaxID=32008 RepID=UPI000758ABB0|nr:MULTISPECIES: hypothetical protein [Burkholderia]KVD17640.1 hypothetical protein WI80_04035 [Burkholderia ubonensis]ONB82873.1 hypothetical protein AQ906_04170 [Burkholderia pseudomallei]